MKNDDMEQGFEPGVGALLKASRLRCGEELRDVASILRIRYPYLEAIEEGNYQDLPGIAYAVGFVRTYADHLGLDSEEVVRRFKAETENIERRTELVFPSPVPERGTPGAAIIFVGVLVAAVAYGAWYVGTSDESVFDDLVSPLPARLAALVGADGGEPAPEEAAPEDASPAASATPEPVVSPAPVEAVPAPVVSSPAEEPAPPASETPAGQSETVMTDSSETSAPPETPDGGLSETPERAAVPTAPAAPSAEAPQTTAESIAVDAPAEAGPGERPVSEEASVASIPVPPSAAEFTTPVVASLPETPDAATAPEIGDDRPGAAETAAVPSVEPVPQATEAPDLPPAPDSSEAEAPEAGTPGEAPAEAPSMAETAATESMPDSATDQSSGVTEQTTPVLAAEPAPAAAAADEPSATDTDSPAVGPAEDAQLAAVPETADPPAAADDPQPAETTQAAVAEPEPPAETMATPITGVSRVVVRAKSDSWIQVRDGVARRLLVTRLLRAGDSYRVPDQPGLTLLTGNAGALEILVDGEPVDSIGDVGVVRRNVALDAEKLKDGTAVLD